MSEISPWMQRKFTFDFPVELYPNLRIRLRGAPARVEEIVRDLKTEQLRRKPDGKWSIQENAGHMWDLELLWATRLVEFLAGLESLTMADIRNVATHTAQHNERPVTDILSGFRSRREGLVNSLERLSVADFRRTALHPRLQMPIRLVDHLAFIAEHDDHHLARMWELRAVSGRRSG